MTYSEKLKDPRWQKRRLEIFNRDKFACRKCGDEKTTLAVHHLYYERGKEPWDYPADALVTLCEPCHNDEFEAKDVDRELLITLKKCGAFQDEILTLSHLFKRPMTPGEWYLVLRRFELIMFSAYKPGGFIDLEAWLDGPPQPDSLNT